MTDPKVSVVICSHSNDRWDQLVAAVASVNKQTEPPSEVVVVIDHNSQLHDRARRELHGVRVIENDGLPGLSAARNTGVRATKESVIAFLDDDAVADPHWLMHLIGPYKDGRVLGVGGFANPVWQDGRPSWFPEEFDWVVGCSYRGLPEGPAPIRNPLGCNMSIRRDVLFDTGGFVEALGRGPAGPLGCEETELCIRARQRNPKGYFLYEPAARVDHLVPRTRSSLRYFLARCFGEGVSKARVTKLVGVRDGLASERAHARGVLLPALRRSGFARRCAVVMGFLFAFLGLLRGFLSRSPEARRIPRPAKSTAGTAVTVVVATRDRASTLRPCLESILAMTFEPFDVLVVDSASTSPDESRRVVAELDDKRLRWLHVARPGLGHAHNVALGGVDAPIVAFTDDDVLVDPRWLDSITKGFTSIDGVACVTGRILPLEIDTQPQQWFEDYVGLNKGGNPRIFDLDGHRPSDPLFPFTAGTMGSGANMAFDTAFLREIGGFDAALGAGSIALGGDDLAAFADVVLRGYRVVYEPAAVVYHRHPRTYAAARRQAYGYGAGMTAYITKLLVDRPSLVFSMARRLPAGIRRARRLRSAPNYPNELTRVERRGMLAGPPAYLWSRVRNGRR